MECGCCDGCVACVNHDASVVCGTWTRCVARAISSGELGVVGNVEMCNAVVKPGLRDSQYVRFVLVKIYRKLCKFGGIVNRLNVNVK